MRNKFAGNCFRCHNHVPAGDGYFQRMNGKWAVRCRKCVGQGNEPISKTAIAKAEGRS